MFQKEAGRTGLSKRGWIGLAATLLSKLDQLSYFRPLGVICSPQGKTKQSSLQVVLSAL
jgi:hypothetical protein